VGLIGLFAKGLHDVSYRLMELDGGGHGPWCEPSKEWAPSFPDGRIVPVRAGDEWIAKMSTDDGWEVDVRAVLLRPAGDGTFQFVFKEAEEVDQVGNRHVQRMVLTALDLAQTLDYGNDDLSEETVEALAEFRRAARSRLGGGGG
jgi:hypothetical protein